VFFYSIPNFFSRREFFVFDQIIKLARNIIGIDFDDMCHAITRKKRMARPVCKDDFRVI
jgi:hypothetical protein